MHTVHCSGHLSCHACPSNHACPLPCMPHTMHTPFAMHTPGHTCSLPHMPPCHAPLPCMSYPPLCTLLPCPRLPCMPHPCYAPLLSCMSPLPCMPPAMHAPCHACPLPCTPSVDRMTDACENMTFPQLLLRTVKTCVFREISNLDFAVRAEYD